MRRTLDPSPRHWAPPLIMFFLPLELLVLFFFPFSVRSDVNSESAAVFEMEDTEPSESESGLGQAPTILNEVAESGELRYGILPSLGNRHLEV